MVEKCCNKRMVAVEYTLQSNTPGFQYDVLHLLSCRNSKCGISRGWAYRLDSLDEPCLIGWVAKDSLLGWINRIDVQLTSRNDHQEKRAMVHISDGTKLMSRDVANIYKKMLHGTTRH